MATQNTSDNQDFLNDLQRHSAIQDARISNFETKFEMFMQSVKESNDRRDAEFRDRDNQRHAEIAELRNSIKEIYQATDAKISKIESKIDTMTSHIQILAVTAVGGIIAAGVGIAAMVISALTKG